MTKISTGDSKLRLVGACLVMLTLVLVLVPPVLARSEFTGEIKNPDTACYDRPSSRGTVLYELDTGFVEVSGKDPTKKFVLVYLSSVGTTCWLQKDRVDIYGPGITWWNRYIGTAIDKLDTVRALTAPPVVTPVDVNAPMALHGVNRGKLSTRPIPKLPVFPPPDDSLDCFNYSRTSIELLADAIDRHTDISTTLIGIPDALSDDRIEELLDEAELVRDRMLRVRIPPCVEKFRDLYFKQLLLDEQIVYADLRGDRAWWSQLMEHGTKYADKANDELGRLAQSLKHSRTSTSAPTGCPFGCTYHKTGCDIKGNVSYSTGERIYHVPDQQYYSQTKISSAYGERWFCTEAEALSNGWRKSKR